MSSCKTKENPLLGVWKINSKFYKATCKIIKDENSVKGLVLYYNDDTTIYKYKEGDGESKNYFFNNLIEKKGTYVDAVSGATKTDKLEEAVTLKLLSKDTLEVTTHIMRKPLKETWIRIQK